MMLIATRTPFYYELFSKIFPKQIGFLLNLNFRINSHLSVRHTVRHISEMDYNSINNEKLDIMRVEIPEYLLQPGQAVWRFKRFFSLLETYKRPITEYQRNSRDDAWVCKISLIEPKQVIVCGEASTKKSAENIALAKGLLWLRDNEYIDQQFNPIFSTLKERQQFIKDRVSPISVAPFNSDVKNELKLFISLFESEIEASIDSIISTFRQTSEAESESEHISDIKQLDDHSSHLNNFEDNFLNPNELEIDKTNRINIINNRRYKNLTISSINKRENQLKMHLMDREMRMKNDKSFAEIRSKLSELPIASHRQHILDTIEQNRVIVIAGDTGCGKTTQIPQYIFENEINNDRASFTNILITQPRRISAISMSERVAVEFGEDDVGKSIGYQVRFNHEFPAYDTGVMLFCSAGILLRKLQSNPTLKGISHVIIDEVHERDVVTDFLLVLLKRILNSNPNVKIILMSASMNANLFVDYFDKCPLVEIPGRCFPVTHYYLDDFLNIIRKYDDRSNRIVVKNPKVNKDLVVDLIEYIDSYKSDGAILCFLPGWRDIQDILEMLRQSNEISCRFKVIPIHSKLPHSLQKQIFSKIPIGLRKVVLATNIAETSITIDDVVYVIDPGLANQIHYNANLNVSAFGTHWISKANAKQRSGRAGRVKAGECYRLYTKQIEFVHMDEYPMPELLRIPLETVIMQAKFHCPQEKVKDFLSELPQSPSHTAIDSAIQTLESINIIDSKENLTPLGMSVINFTTHPRLSVSLVNSAMFGCLSSMLNIVSHLSATREPYQVMPDQRSEIRRVKKEFCCSLLSDHIALTHLTSEYENVLNDIFECEDFCSQHLLSSFAMNTILELKRLFAQHLEEAKFVERHEWKNLKSDVNCHWHQKQLIISTLMSGLYPNFVRILNGDIKNNKINRKKQVIVDVNTGKAVKFVSDSIFNEKADLKQLENEILITYFSSYFSKESNMLNIRDASVVTPVNFILFGGKRLKITKLISPEIKDEQNDNEITRYECVVMLDNNNYLQFRINIDDLQLLNRWNTIKEKFLHWYVIDKLGNTTNLSDNYSVSKALLDFVSLTSKILQQNMD